ncbi:MULTISPECIES: hypothetical protein [unclassified Streptomyces]|uniref:hypothetical protein n=1 Tax=unclassified Streptomyces TaxID=2593676 RepID=UPI0036EE9164
MTQSGQGEEPSPRVAREGIVLPSDGGEPLLPGQTGGPGGHPSAPHTPTPAAPPSSAPPGGQAWGTPWGPEAQSAGPQQGQGWDASQGGQWGTPDPDPYQAQAQAHAQAQAQAQAQWGGAAQEPSRPLPQEGAPAGGYDSDQPTSYYLPPVGQNAQAAPQPPAGPSGPMPAAHPDAYGYPAPGAPLPPADEGATQYLPPVAAAPDEGATQYLPPVPPGPLPPEAPRGGGAEQTQFLGRPQRSASGPDAEATQFIPPVPGQHDGERQPPAEFDNLFRSGPGGDSPAGATQQLPRFEAGPPPRAGRPQPSYDHDDDGGGRGGRGRSRVPVIAAVGIGIAALGIGAGALLAGGGGDDGDGNKPVAASEQTSESASPSADPAEAQAVELDKLLADSGDSRASVISAVEDVKACRNLGQAAKDLRDAATQRNDLVTRLSGLSVDKLPDHARLTTALTKAWEASAAADNHYAAWADQTAGKRGCKKGQARSTAETQAGNQASGEASAQKTAAARLWNAIAKTYGLTERTRTQL